MSDSYAAWCEAQDENACMFSEKNIAKVKRTKAFAKLLKQAKDAYKSVKLREAKCCKNCMHNEWLNNHNICEKLGIVLDDDDLVCKKWSGAPYAVPQPTLNENVIAWIAIQDNMKNYLGKCHV